MRKNEIRLIALGGLGEIGKNLMLLEYNRDMIAIDCGLAFPEDSMPGVDLVIPDISYLVENKERLRGIVLTHGHEDHVGALPWVLKDVNVPVYGTKLTLGLARRKMDENFQGEFRFNVVSPRDVVEFGDIKVEFVRVTHSVADSVGLIIHTPLGTIVHTGDFKLDQTPVDGEPTDLFRFAEVGEKGVLALLSDSTHADRPGYTPSEREVGESLKAAFFEAKGRIILTTFASNVPRIQQVIDAAQMYGRKVCVVGRSMETVVEVASNMGFIKAPLGTLIDVDHISRYPSSKLVIISTGSQGEPLSALARISAGEHRKIKIEEGDLVIMAASPVPGNETTVSGVVDNLFRRGAEVIYTPESGVHVSGHASREEQKIMLNLTKPRFFIPVHGEYRHMVLHGQLAEATGVPKSNILIGENGTIFRLTHNKGEIVGSVPTRHIFIDGLGVGDIGDTVLRERQGLSDSGVVCVFCVLTKNTGTLVTDPVFRSAGFMRTAFASELIEQVLDRTKEYFSVLPKESLKNIKDVESEVASSIHKILRHETGRRPLVICNISIV